MAIAPNGAEALRKVLRGATAGLIAGALASFAMDRFQAAAARLQSNDASGDEPTTAKAADKLLEIAGGHRAAEADQPLAGQIVHYALGTGLGIAYAIAAEFRPQVAAGYGSAFGIGVAAVLDEGAVPAAGLSSAPWKTAPAMQLYTVTSHLVFGAAAEFTRRQVRATLFPKA